ncbi:MAG: hypothetical protein K1X31_00940 [Gemmatimonadaceae bacterium]|nr:hypothetical protein [Gemmatimonadaceae bacterium]
MDLTVLSFLVVQALAQVPATLAAVPDRASTPAAPVVLARFDAARGGVGRGPRGAAPDTAFEYSAAYYRRLDVHRTASYFVLPLFAFQYAAGRQLVEKSFEAPAWARTGHRVAATGVAALFGLNTFTGVQNLWEARRDPTDRGRRTFHGVTMLVADAGFVATGLLADRAETSGDARDLHRAVALSSIGIATVSYLTMLDVFASRR